MSFYPPGRFAYRFPGYQPDLNSKTSIGIWVEMLKEKRPLSEREHSHLISQYDAEILYLDEQLRLLDNELRERGLFHDSLIILVSDHGEFFGEHEMMDHREGLYSEVLDIPLIIKYPGGEPSGENNDRFENRELFNLILSQAGISPSKADFPRVAIAEIYSQVALLSREEGQSIEPTIAQRAVFFDQFKYIASQDGANELYDLSSDPDELSNLIHREPEEGARAKKLMEKFINTVKDGEPEEKYRKLSPAEIKQLEALGYL